MKTVNEVFYFCNEFTFYDHHNIERVGQLNHVRDCVISVLSKYDFISEDKTNRVVVVIDDTSLMITDENVENLVQEINNLRVGFEQLLCLENLHKEENDNEERTHLIIDSKEIISHDKIKSFQAKNRFLIKKSITIFSR